MWEFAILIVVALGAVGLIAAGRSTPLPAPPTDRPDLTVPRDRALGADDLRGVRFSVGLRGYRMDEVDALLERLAAEADERHQEPTQAPRPEPEPEPEA